MTHPPFNRRRLLALLVAVALSAPACGSSDSGGGASTPEPTTTDATAVPAGFDASAYCSATLAIEQAQPDIDFESATPEGIAAGLQAWAIEDLQPQFDAIEAAAPAELDAAVETYGAAIAELAETGDPSVFEMPELADAEATTHAFDLANCGWSTADVVASEFAFTGLEETYEPGPLSIDLTNEGDEVHELLVLKVKDGVDESAEDLVRLSEDEAFEKVEWVGNIDPVAPGDGDYVVVDLESGRYVVSCFLPEGATDMEHLDADGEPHALSGMVAEITVS